MASSFFHFASVFLRERLGLARAVALASGLAMVAWTAPAHAQNSALNPLGVETIDALILIILNAIVTIGIPVLTFFFVLTGFYYVTAMGDTNKVGKAHTMFQYTLIGSAVVLGAKVLYEILRGTLTKLL